MNTQPKPTGDCTCDNAFGLHWGNCPINMNTKPTGEWTAERVARYFSTVTPPNPAHLRDMADAHNAALAAAIAAAYTEGYTKAVGQWLRGEPIHSDKSYHPECPCSLCRNAAIKPLVDALIKIANDPNCDRCQVAVDALAKVKEWK